MWFAGAMILRHLVRKLRIRAANALRRLANQIQPQLEYSVRLVRRPIAWTDRDGNPCDGPDYLDDQPQLFCVEEAGASAR